MTSLSETSESHLDRQPEAIPRDRRVYVNRTLRMDKVEIIGFDMDHTLAVYRAEPTERLAMLSTIDKLIRKKGYPEEIRHLDYDSRFAIRGLCVDTQLGNLLKFDRHGHIGRVLHGRRPLPKEERYDSYRGLGRPTAPRFTWIDSLFSLPEGAIYARLVDFFDERSRAKVTGMPESNYERLWEDVRECIDEAHRDGSIKGIIRQRPEDFIERAPELPSTLHKFRSAGRRLFLLTNSEWEYTEVVMSWLLPPGESNYPTWRHYFDFIVVLARKPEFFRCDEPFVEIDETGRDLGSTRQLHRGRLYRGGSISDFEASIGADGDRVLYVGDHIYSDIVRSKRSSAWRTALVVQELEDETRIRQEQRGEIQRLEDLEHEIARLDAEVNWLQGRLKAWQKRAEDEPSPDVEAAKRVEKERLDRTRTALRETVAKANALQDQVDHAFHRWWGPVFKEEDENSKFGEQVEEYACIYSSRVTNLLYYSPLAYFRAPRQHMPHEIAE